MAALTNANIDYCILHGYQQLEFGITGDIDCIIPTECLPTKAVEALIAAGLWIVQNRQHEYTAHCLFVAAPEYPVGVVLQLDLASDYRRDGRVFFSGEEFLHSRVKFGEYWVTSPALEFGYSLVKRIGKRSLHPSHYARLSQLYQIDPYACEQQISRFWQQSSVEMISEAASSGVWVDIQDGIKHLQTELLRRQLRLKLVRTVGYYWLDLLRKLKRWWKPNGVHVVILGPDGAGKSAVIEGLQRRFPEGPFRKITVYHLSPGLFRQKRATSRIVVDPHGKPARSLLGSLMKVGLWSVDYLLGYIIRVRPGLSRSELIVFDRYFADVLVDPKRFRYGGPKWIVLILWRLVPKPDVFILLDGEAEVLQSRKQEVDFEETRRQRLAYRSLMDGVGRTKLVDAEQPLDIVIEEVSSIVLKCGTITTLARLVGKSNGKGRVR